MKKLNQILTLVVTLGLFSAVAVQAAGKGGTQQIKNTRSQVNEALRLQRETAKLAEQKQNPDITDEAIERQTEVVEKQKKQS